MAGAADRDTAAPADTRQSGIAGIRVVRGAQWNALLFEAPQPVLSSAPVGGGDRPAHRVVNLCVAGEAAIEACDDPAGHVRGCRRGAGLDGRRPWA